MFSLALNSGLLQTDSSRVCKCRGETSALLVGASHSFPLFDYLYV